MIPRKVDPYGASITLLLVLIFGLAYRDQGLIFQATYNKPGASRTPTKYPLWRTTTHRLTETVHDRTLIAVIAIRRLLSGLAGPAPSILIIGNNVDCFNEDNPDILATALSCEEFDQFSFDFLTDPIHIVPRESFEDWYCFSHSSFF